MIIKWLGHSAFEIVGSSTLITDPYNHPRVGELPVGLTADVVTVSHEHRDHNYVEGVKDSPIVINTVGEFNVGEFDIKGIATLHDKEGGTLRGNNTVFTIFAEGIKLCHLGDLGHTLTEEQVSEIGPVDILMIPVGGTYTIDASEAVQVVSQLNPKIVLPMHYKPGNSSMTLPIDGVEQFNALLGWDVIEETNELKIDRTTMELMGHKIVVFRR